MIRTICRLAIKTPPGTQTLTSREFPSFEPRKTFYFEDVPHWWDTHMTKGKVAISKSFKKVDVVIEVRDARVPFSSAQYEMSDAFSSQMLHKQRIIVLNKCDLVSKRVLQKTRIVLEEQMGLPVIMVSAIQKKNIAKIRDFAIENVSPKWDTIGTWMMVVGLPNVGKSTIINALKRIAFSTASKGPAGFKSVHGLSRVEAKMGSVPGVTVKLDHFPISVKPKLFCIDTPGVMLLKSKIEVERNVKLAAIGVIPSNVTSNMYIADYILYRLNLMRNFKYVEVLELAEPVNSVKLLTSRIGQVFGGNRGNMTPDNHAGAQYFVDMFRAGAFGLVCLDDIPDEEDLEKFRGMLQEAEPPGPWGPSNYGSDQIFAGRHIFNQRAVHPQRTGFNHGGRKA